MSEIQPLSNTIESHKQGYRERIMGWALKACVIFISKDVLSQITPKAMDILKKFEYDPHSKQIIGEVEVTKVRDVIKQAMQSIQSLFQIWCAITATFYIMNRICSCIPFLPTLCLIMNVGSGVITWDLYQVVRQMKCAMTHFNRLHLQKSHVNEELTKKPWVPFRISFEHMVEIIDSYAEQMLCDLWWINCNQKIKDSLTHTRPHLQEQIKNLSNPQGEPLSAWRIAVQYFPLLKWAYPTSDVPKPSNEQQ